MPGRALRDAARPRGRRADAVDDLRRTPAPGTMKRRLPGRHRRYAGDGFGHPYDLSLAIGPDAPVEDAEKARDYIAVRLTRSPSGPSGMQDTQGLAAHRTPLQVLLAQRQRHRVL